jgi:polyphosphate glucokinase
MQILGVDIGGSGIKGAVVDTVSGLLITEPHRIPTPQSAIPEAVAATLAQLVVHFDWTGLVGRGFPSAIQHGVARTASNISPLFIGADIDKLCLTDADAAGMTEKCHLPYIEKPLFRINNAGAFDVLGEVFI